MGYQFAHIENFSRKADRKGRSVSFVLAEARRDPGASLHVLSPRLPEVVHGCAVDEVERRHDDRAAAARSLRIDKGVESSRAIRKDQQTLCTVIVSHPYTVAEVEADPAKRSEVERWERLNVAWLRAQYGDDLVSVIRHTDERQWHLHAYVLPSSADMKASVMHPGYRAKALEERAGGPAGETSKDASKRVNRAYKAAMRQWQDSYSKAVGVPCGLTRLGPGVRRLERAEWHQEQVQAKALKEARDRAETLKIQGGAHVRKVKGEAASLREAAAQVVAAAAAAQEQARRLQQEADARAAVALSAENVARKQQEEARRATEQAKRDTLAARRLAGFSGALRGFWDGMRKSSLAARLRKELLPTVEGWRSTADAAVARAAAADVQRRAAEAKAVALRSAAAEVGAQRDELRARLARYEPVVDVAPVPVRHHP